MKQDMELIKIMLQTLADNDNYYMKLDIFAKQMQEKIGTKELYDDKLVGHFFLAKDANLIEELGVCFFVGPTFASPTPANGGKLRITSQGLQFLEALNNKGIFKKIKNFSIGLATNVGTGLLTQYISGKLHLP